MLGPSYISIVNICTMTNKPHVILACKASHASRVKELAAVFHGLPPCSANHTRTV